MIKQLKAAQVGEEIDENEKQKHFENLEQLLNTIKKDIIKMKKRRDKEKFANKRLLSNHLGEIISFGTSIQLMHYNSESFLNGRIICSEFDKSAYKFELSKNYKEGMIF